MRRIPFIDNDGEGVADDASGISFPAGVYYIGVSSKNNINYDPNVNGTAQGGTATGAYSIKVSFTDAPAAVDDTPTFNNSSFGSPTVFGVLGNGGKTLTGATIAPSPDLSQQYGIQMPGAGDAPGERNIPFQSHLTTVPGAAPRPKLGYRDDYLRLPGSLWLYPPQGQQFTNAITKAQKAAKVRKALELYSRYLGVQFAEVSGEQIANITIATGDPRAIAQRFRRAPATPTTERMGLPERIASLPRPIRRTCSRM